LHEKIQNLQRKAKENIGNPNQVAGNPKTKLQNLNKGFVWLRQIYPSANRGRYKFYFSCEDLRDESQTPENILKTPETHASGNIFEI